MLLNTVPSSKVCSQYKPLTYQKSHVLYLISILFTDNSPAVRIRASPEEYEVSKPSSNPRDELISIFNSESFKFCHEYIYKIE